MTLQIDMHLLLPELFPEEGAPAIVVRALTAETHPDDDHEFQDDPRFPGVCSVCRWFPPDAVCSHCGQLARRHIMVINTDEIPGLNDLLEKLSSGEITFEFFTMPRRPGRWRDN